MEKQESRKSLYVKNNTKYDVIPYMTLTDPVKQFTVSGLQLERLRVSAALWPQPTLVWLSSLAAQLGSVVWASSPLPCCFGLDNVILQRAGPAAHSLH